MNKQTAEILWILIFESLNLSIVIKLFSNNRRKAWKYRKLLPNLSRSVSPQTEYNNKSSKIKMFLWIHSHGKQKKVSPSDSITRLNASDGGIINEKSTCKSRGATHTHTNEYLALGPTDYAFEGVYKTYFLWELVAHNVVGMFILLSPLQWQDVEHRVN